jgi:hypothetical protein
MRRALSNYLLIAPLLFPPLYFVYHFLGLKVGIAAGALHLVLIALAMRARGLFKRDELPTAYGLTRVLLIGGGAVVWATGASGPPSWRDPTLGFYNNIGLTTGFFVTLLGLAALKIELQSERKGTLAALGYTAHLMFLVTWFMVSMLIWSEMGEPRMAVHDPVDWLLFIFRIHDRLPSWIAAFGYLAGALCAGAALMTGRVGRRLGTVMIVFSLLGVAFGIAQMMPFLIPAVTCLVPYYLGTQLLPAARSA